MAMMDSSNRLITGKVLMANSLQFETLISTYVEVKPNNRVQSDLQGAPKLGLVLQSEVVSHSLGGLHRDSF